MTTFRYYCCSREECDGCVDERVKLHWDTFCAQWLWIAHNNALVQINKFLIDDLGKMECALDAAIKKTGKSFTTSLTR
jgi:hypothetical protein